MSYQAAMKCFEENVRLIGAPGNDLEKLTLWNLSHGLTMLAQSVSSDFGALEQRIAGIEAQLRQIRP